MKFILGTLICVASVSVAFAATDKKAVDSQVTDSVTQANTKVVGEAPAVAMGNVYQAKSQASQNNANVQMHEQAQANVESQASDSAGVQTLYDQLQ